MSEPIRVLLVEDNPADAELTRESLEMGRLRVSLREVRDGQQALELLMAHAEPGDPQRPDLIILDLNLPGLSGQEVLARVRQHPSLRVIPVVILTSSEAERDIIKSYDLGANCYVTKPLDLVQFQAIVAAIEDFWFTIVRLPRATPAERL